jgi:glycosyltransferase involved in cell wall biosynthesis
LYELVRRFPTSVEVEMFVPALPDVLGGDSSTERLGSRLAAAVKSTNEYAMPWLGRRTAGRFGVYADWVLGGEAMRLAQRRIAADINRRGFDVAFLCACRFSQSVPIAEWLKVPSVYFAQEIRRASFETQPLEQSRAFKGFERVVPILRRPHEAVCRRRDLRAVAAVDRVLCNSHFSADLFSTMYGVDPTVCYLGVDTEAFACRRDDPAEDGAKSVARARTRPFKALSVGALHPIKGHDLALLALATASRSTGVAAELHVVYERAPRPGVEKELQNLAAVEGIGLQLHRCIPDAELASLYRLSDVTVCAARLEPFGLTALESMSCGTPVVAVAQGGYRETVVDRVNGYLVERSVGSLSEGIARVMRGELSATAHGLNEYARRWGWEAAADRVVKQLRLVANL